MSEYGYHRSTFWRNTKIFKNRNIFIPESKDRHLVIYLDGNNWRNFLKSFNEPEYVVCDGQNGLIKSIWFNTKIQRC